MRVIGATCLPFLRFAPMPIMLRHQDYYLGGKGHGIQTCSARSGDTAEGLGRVAVDSAREHTSGTAKHDLVKNCIIYDDDMVRIVIPCIVCMLLCMYRAPPDERAPNKTKITVCMYVDSAQGRV